MSSYAKHLKEILSNTGKLENFGIMGLNKECSVIYDFLHRFLTDVESIIVYISFFKPILT